MIAVHVRRFFADKPLLENIFRAVALHGAASAPLLDALCCAHLLKDAETKKYVFTREPEAQGKEDARVYQQLETVLDFPEESDFLLLRDVFEALLSSHAEFLPEYPFSFAPAFNSITLARYPAGSIGITPHLDHLKYKNLLCIFVLGGKGKFFVCADRAGNGAREIDASVGNVIFLRCPGFMGIAKRPFHFLKDIAATRYSFVLRQEQPCS